MRMRLSLRFKVALAFSALIIVLLATQTLGVTVLVETQVERFISALIADDMAGLVRSYRLDPALMPPLDARLAGHVSQAGQAHVTLPETARTLGPGVHELIIGGREIHVAVAPLANTRIYRVYDFSAYEQHFRDMSGVLMAGAGIFALLSIWLAYGLSGLLLRQIAAFVRQVKALRLGADHGTNPGKYDEEEVVELVAAFNDYHRRMAHMVEREKEFTANLSHELRTPLTAIKTSCELLEQDASIGLKSRARLRQIDLASQRMGELLNALLLLAREESSEEAGPVCLAEVIEDALAPFADALALRGGRAEIRIDRSLCVKANRAALLIVISNLVDNAVRHARRGDLRFDYESGSLHIEDTGAGIPPEELSRVFERFYQADTSAAGGLGIGLAIVKKICDRHHWRIELDSTLGQGTRVSVSLPLASRKYSGFTKN